MRERRHDTQNKVNKHADRGQHQNSRIGNGRDDFALHPFLRFGIERNLHQSIRQLATHFTRLNQRQPNMTERLGMLGKRGVQRLTAFNILGLLRKHIT